MNLIIKRPHEQYDCIVFIKQELVINTPVTRNNDNAILTVDIDSFSITLLYKSPDKQFKFARFGSSA